jgi:hypothetical protein
MSLRAIKLRSKYAGFGLRASGGRYAGRAPVALVSGANRGIGRETARQLAERGHHVIVTARTEASG